MMSCGRAIPCQSAPCLPRRSREAAKEGRRSPMKRRLRIVSGAIVLALVALASAVVSTQGQPASGAQAPYSPPRTPWGDPDLQGIWPGTDSVGVPFERPEKFGTRLYLTDAELKEREQQAAQQQELDVLDFDLQKPPAEIVALGDVGGVTSPPPHLSLIHISEPTR